MTGAALEKLAAELGIDAIGAAPVAAYDDTEQHIRERRSRGLFADMRFTMARPEISCHPETLLEGAKTVVAAALCYYRDAPEPAADEALLPRYTWRDEYAELRARLDALGRRLGGSTACSSTRTTTSTVQPPSARASPSTARTRWRSRGATAPGSCSACVVTDVEIETSPALELDCGECRLCIDACPTGALDEPGTLDATKCLSYWTQAPAPIPEAYRAEVGRMVYGCDICQDVCPWNRGIEKRRRGEEAAAGANGHVSLVDWLERDGAELVAEFDRLYVPRNDPRWLRRNALVAAGNVGSAALVPSVSRYADDPDPVLRDAADWALARIAEREA